MNTLELSYRYPKQYVAICPKCTKDVYSGPIKKFYCRCGNTFKALNAMSVKSRIAFMEGKKVK
jgi:hypothetical protein